MFGTVSVHPPTHSWASKIDDEEGNTIFSRQKEREQDGGEQGSLEEEEEEESSPHLERPVEVVRESSFGLFLLSLDRPRGSLRASRPPVVASLLRSVQRRGRGNGRRRRSMKACLCV